jgi:predicted enzyme related to lactoylglutathione lyase
MSQLGLEDSAEDQPKTKMTFDEFMTIAISLNTVGFKETIKVLDFTADGQRRVLVDGQTVWRFVERDGAGQLDINLYRTKDLYLLALWKTGGYGTNTTDSVPVHPEKEQEVFTSLSLLLDRVCPNFSWTKAGNLFREIALGTLGEKGQYENTEGDGALEEDRIFYAYKAVNLRALHRWLIESGLLVGELTVPLFQCLDCIRIPISDLEQGLAFYRDQLGHALIWRTAEAAGLRIPGTDTEIVLFRDLEKMEVDWKVESVDEATKRFLAAGGKMVQAPFDIPIGRCVVVQDPWGNELVLLDTSKGLLKTDENGNVIGNQPV